MSVSCPCAPTVPLSPNFLGKLTRKYSPGVALFLFCIEQYVPITAICGRTVYWVVPLTDCFRNNYLARPMNRKLRFESDNRGTRASEQSENNSFCQL